LAVRAAVSIVCSMPAVDETHHGATPCHLNMSATGLPTPVPSMTSSVPAGQRSNSACTIATTLV
jgi:hypothetical protein